MQIKVNFRNMKPSNALRDYALKRTAKISKLLIKPESGEVLLEEVKELHIAKLTLHANGEIFTGKHEDEDMYAAIDLVSDKVERQARRYKEKLTNHRPR